MNDIQRVLGQASRRLWVTDTLRTLSVMLCVALSGLLITLIGERLFSLTLPWKLIASSTVAAAGLVALAWSVIARKRSLAVARVLDERAGLKETLSTALYMNRQDDPWSKAVVESASTVAKNVRVGDAIPIQIPKLWPVPLTLLLVLGLVWKFLAPMDLLKTQAVKTAQQQKQQAIVEVKADLEKKEAEIKAALAKANLSLPEKQDDASKGDEKKPQTKDQDPDSLRRERSEEHTSGTPVTQ